MRAEPTSHGFGIMNAPGPSWSSRKRVALSCCVTIMQPISDQNLPSRIADRKHARSATRQLSRSSKRTFADFEKACATARPHKRTAARGRGMCYPQPWHAPCCLCLFGTEQTFAPRLHPSSSCALCAPFMKRRRYRLHVETTPPEPIPALVEARWLKLADQALHPERSKQAAPPPGTRAHQEHQRLEQEIDQALAKHNDEPDPANFIKIFDHGQDSSRTHPEPGAKAQTSQCASDGRSRRKATQSARIRAAGR